MNLYVDTSCLVKRYVDEPHRDEVLEWIAAADTVATSRVSYPETAAAIAARHRLGHISLEQVQWALQDLADRWAQYLVIDLAEFRAAELAVKHALHGFDAVQLAAAVEVSARSQAVGLSCTMISADAELNTAAMAEGLRVIDPNNHP